MRIRHSHGGLPELPRRRQAPLAQVEVLPPPSVWVALWRLQHSTQVRGTQGRRAAPLERSIGSSHRIRSTAPLSRHACAHESRIH